MKTSNIEVRKLLETEYTIYDVHALIKKVYECKKEEGIHFQALSKSTEEIEKRIKEHKGVVFVAVNSSSNEMVGTATVLFHNDKKNQLYAGFILAAVSPDYQGKGIGRMLRLAREDYAKKMGCIYISSSTASNADSSVRYHLNNGSKKYGFSSQKGADYYSIFFRKYLVRTYKSNIVYCTIRYNYHKLKTIILYKDNGSLTKVGKLYNKMIRLR